MLSFDRSRLTCILEALPEKHRVAFMASCCERLVPNYLMFAPSENRGGSQSIQTALDVLWAWLDSTHVSKAELRRLLEVCEGAAISVSDSDSPFRVLAEEGASALAYSLEASLTGDSRLGVTVGALAISTLDQFLSIIGDPLLPPRGGDPVNAGDTLGVTEAQSLAHQRDLDAWIQKSPLMLAELRKQDEDLAELKSMTDVDAAFLQRLRRSSQWVGIQPFRRWRSSPCLLRTET